MKITMKELELIVSTPEKECAICNELIRNIYIDTEGYRYIDSYYLRHNPDVREHLRQIIRR